MTFPSHVEYEGQHPEASDPAPAASARQRRLVLLDIAPRVPANGEAPPPPLLAEAVAAGFCVTWITRVDVAPGEAPGVQAHRLLAPLTSPTPPRLSALPEVRPRSTLRRLALVVLPAPLISLLRPFLRRGVPNGALVQARRLGYRLVNARADREILVALLEVLGSEDLVVLRGAEPQHLELLLELVPHLGRDAPLPATLHAVLAAEPRVVPGRGELDIPTLARRMASGFPFARLVLHSPEPAAMRLQELLGLPVRALRVGAEAPGLPDIAATSPSPSLTCEAWGPVALVVSALWGRVGSSAIFDAQTRHLIDRGYLVVRVLIEHWPHLEPARSRRIAAFLGENFELVRPHAWLLAERRDNAGGLRRLFASPEFRKASVVGRVQLMFRDAKAEEPDALRWAGQRAAVAVVNHLPHLMFAEALTPAPIVLETHDIYAELVRSHGVPGFLPPTPPAPEAERREEEAAWARVAVCVNLSSDDHVAIAAAARHAVLARPYLVPRAPSGRDWLTVVAANGLPDAFRDLVGIDLLLWGGWHQGNVDGVTWFVDEVLPLDPALATARVAVIGRVLEGLDRDRLAARGVLAAGFVDRLEDLLAKAKVLVVPDRGGSGISVKAMEALAIGAPFAATNAALRGLDRTGVDYAPAEDAAALARDIATLLASGEARRARAAVARALYERNFSAAAYARAMDTALAHALPGGAVPPSPVPSLDEPAPASPVTPAAAAPLAMVIPARSASGGASWVGPPRLSAVVCTHRRYGLLGDAIASLLTQDCPFGFLEVIVVDNSPDHEAAAAFGERYASTPVVRYLREPARGLSNARNRGLAAASAGLVAFIDDDAIACPTWARELVAAFDALGETVGVVGGRVLPRFVSPRPLWLDDTLLGYLSVVDWGGSLRVVGKAEWIAGCNMAFRREAALSAGAFNVGLGRTGAGVSLMSNEENDLIARIQAGGGQVGYAPTAIVEHVIDPTRLTPAWFRRRAAWQAVSDIVADPERAAEYGPRAVAHVRLVAAARATTPRLGVYPPSGIAAVVSEDVGTAYDLIMAMLHSGGAEPEAAGPIGKTSARDAAMARVRSVLLRNPRLLALARAVRRKIS